MAATTSDNSIVSTSSASLSLPALSTDKYYTYDTDIRPNLSPTRDAWNNFLGLKWQRGSWGDWIDATGKEFGQSTV